MAEGTSIILRYQYDTPACFFFFSRPCTLFFIPLKINFLGDTEFHFFNTNSRFIHRCSIQTIGNGMPWHETNISLNYISRVLISFLLFLFFKSFFYNVGHLRKKAVSSKRCKNELFFVLFFVRRFIVTNVISDRGAFPLIMQWLKFE